MTRQQITESTPIVLRWGTLLVLLGALVSGVWVAAVQYAELRAAVGRIERHMDADCTMAELGVFARELRASNKGLIVPEPVLVHAPVRDGGGG